MYIYIIGVRTPPPSFFAKLYITLTFFCLSRSCFHKHILYAWLYMYVYTLLGHILLKFIFNLDIFHILIKYNIPLSQINMHKTTKTQRCIQMYVCFTFQSLRIKHKFKNITFYIIIHWLNTAVPFVLRISTIHCKPLSSLPRARGLPMAITKLRDCSSEGLEN